MLPVVPSLCPTSLLILLFQAPSQSNAAEAHVPALPLQELQWAQSQRLLAQHILVLVQLPPRQRPFAPAI